MARIVFEYDPPERFVVGTVGEPGARTFFLQARGGGRTTSVSLEKQQVSVLAERVDALLDEVVRRSAGEADVPAVTPAEAADAEPLDAPIEEEFRVGVMALVWDPDEERVVIEAQALTEGDDDSDDDDPPLIDDDEVDGPPLLRVRLTGAAARGFVTRAQAVVAAAERQGVVLRLALPRRPPPCPRANGYRR